MTDPCPDDVTGTSGLDDSPPITEARQVEGILYRTEDAATLIDGRPVPAMTTMLYRVCDSDPGKFKEATRLVELFIRQALAVKVQADV